MKTRLIFPEMPPKRMLPSSSPGYFYAIERLCRSMRADEQLQHMLVMGADPTVDEYDPRIAAKAMLHIEGTSFWYVGDDDEPVAAGGYAMDPAVPGVWQSWMVGTEDGWARYWRDLTKGSRWLMAQLFFNGARRLETTQIASRDRAARWHTEFLGMQLEGARRRYFPDGSDMLLFSMTDHDFWAQYEPQSAVAEEA